MVESPWASHPHWERMNFQSDSRTLISQIVLSYPLTSISIPKLPSEIKSNFERYSGLSIKPWSDKIIQDISVSFLVAIQINTPGLWQMLLIIYSCILTCSIYLSCRDWDGSSAGLGKEGTNVYLGPGWSHLWVFTSNTRAANACTPWNKLLLQQWLILAMQIL